jgi:hypothetical protein
MKMVESFSWYANTAQDNKDLFKLAIKTLLLTPRGQELAKKIEGSLVDLNPTVVKFIRMMHLGFYPRFHEKRFMVKAFRKCIKSQHTIQSETEKVITKPNIQVALNAKVKLVKGEIDDLFTKFVDSNYTLGHQSVKSIASLIPANRFKDIIEYLNNYYLTDHRQALAGKADMVEAYSHLSKKELKNCVAWIERAIDEVGLIGASKKVERKPRKKKTLTPSKIVGKLKYMKECPSLKLTSVNPIDILKSTEIWAYDVKKRKLQHFVAMAGCTFDVKGNKILNVDNTKSFQKTIRKPEEQLSEFAKLGKPASGKWFAKIKAVETQIRNTFGIDCVILRTVK